MEQKQVLIIQNFTNRKHNKSLHETEILIWTAGLIRYRSFGYKTKLYCSKDDLPFLAEWKLDKLYDEIDSEYLDSEESGLSQIDGEHFWSCRKIAAIHHEVSEVKPDALVVYSDTDIIMEVPFVLESCDCLFWSPEKWSETEGDIYVDWSVLSKPAAYEMPDYILQNKEAYNCGIIYFKDAVNFEVYRKAYLDFVVGNPCVITPNLQYDGPRCEKLKRMNNVWACNSEQRILYAVVHDLLNLDVACIMEEKAGGICLEGSHYFILRMCWKDLASYFIPPKVWLKSLNETVYKALKTIKEYDQELLDFWYSTELLKYKNFLDTYQPFLSRYPIKKYK